MTDVKISSFATTPPPLTGAELITGLSSGVNKNMSTAAIAAVSGAVNLKNGVFASATNTTQIVHSYTLSAQFLQAGDQYIYSAKFSAVSTNASPVTGQYSCDFIIGATPYSFSIDNIPIAQNAANTVGFIEAQFSLSSINSGTLICQYQIHLFDPNNPNTETYTNYDFISQPFSIGTDSLEIFSSLTSSSTDLTLTIDQSNLQSLT